MKKVVRKILSIIVTVLSIIIAIVGFIPVSIYILITKSKLQSYIIKRMLRLGMDEDIIDIGRLIYEETCKECGSKEIFKYNSLVKVADRKINERVFR